MARLMSLVCLLFLCMVSFVGAVGVMLKEENDVFSFPGTDYYYSQGLDIIYTSDMIREEEAVSRKLYGIRNLIYTPMDITIPEPQPWDRPWAGLTAFTYTRWELRKGIFTSEQWMFGTVGEWSQSDHIQTWFHEVIGSRKPMGWANQIPNELIANYTWNRFNSIWYWGDKDGWGVDLTRRYGYSLGNAFVNGEGSFLARAGWNIPKDYRMGLIQPTLTMPDFISKLSLYVFAEAAGRIPLQNITLGGSLFQEGTSQELKYFVSENRVGSSMTLRDIFGTHTDLDLSYSLVFRSREFVGQEKNMEYGSITIALLKGF